ncbi:cytochrome P450, partial [Lojkania enalia]
SEARSYVRCRYLAYRYLYKGASMIDEEYKKSDGKPFMIYTPERINIMITSQQHIEEMDKALRRDLSLHAVAKDLIQPKHTLRGFVWKDQRGVEGTGFFRAIRNLLTANLPLLMPRISEAISSQFEIELQNNADFMEAALSFPEDVYVAAEIIRLLPKFIGPMAARFATRGHKSTFVLYDCLYPVIANRMRAKNQAPCVCREASQDNDAIQWLIDTVPKRENWSTERLVGEIVAVWYASIHTLATSMAYALIDLYSHPEYIEPLRREVEGPLFKKFQTTSEGLPEIDSFLKESTRLSYFESSFIRRQALRDYRFFDGTNVKKGSWVCVPYRSMLRDENTYPHALIFDGRRFLQLDHGNTPKSSSLSHHSSDWLVWGSGRITCPGRFYATLVLKLVIAHMVRNYDCELEPIEGNISFQWRSALIPKNTVTLRVKRHV